MKTDERCYVEIPSVKCIRKEILIWYAHSLYDVRVVWSLLSVSVICVRVCVLPQAVKEVGGECGSRAGDRAATVISLTSHHWSQSGQRPGKYSILVLFILFISASLHQTDVTQQKSEAMKVCVSVKARGHQLVLYLLAEWRGSNPLRY